MDYLELKSTKAILHRVATSDGALAWYNIVKDVDQLDLERVPPTYYVLKELTNNGYLRIEPPNGGNNAKYWLTDSGRELLERLSADRTTKQSE